MYFSLAILETHQIFNKKKVTVISYGNIWQKYYSLRIMNLFLKIIPYQSIYTQYTKKYI